MVVVAIMSIVLVIAGSGLISLSTTTNRGSGMVTDEQQASSVMAQLAKDIRSANRISYTADNTNPQTSNISNAQTSNLLILKENQATGGYQSVEWLYISDPQTCRSLGVNSGDLEIPSACLVREVNVGGRYSPTTGLYTPNGSYSTSGVSVSRVITPLVDATGNSVPLFTYYNETGGIAGNDPITLGNCTTRVQVNLEIAPSNTGAGIRPFMDTEDVTMTDQVATLSQPGNGQC
jgi:hypothetical protein